MDRIEIENEKVGEREERLNVKMKRLEGAREERSKVKMKTC